MDRFVVQPNGPLAGTVRAGGAKNSALKLMAACLLAEGRHVLDNVPDIVDVDIMTDVLEALGATVTRPDRGTPEGTATRPDRGTPEGTATRPDRGTPEGTATRPDRGTPEGTATRPDRGTPEGTATRPDRGTPEGTATRPAPGTLVVETPPPDRLVPEAPYDLVEKMRASIVVLGPLLARCREARVSMPGGDDFGARPIDFHLSSLGAMGTRFHTAHGYVEGRVGSGPADRLVGAHLVLEYPSHTATDNVLMAATLAKGTTVIENAAREPEVCDLASFLNAMGACVRGAGTSRIEVEGVEELRPVRHRVVPDRVVAATFLAAVGLAGGEVVVEDGRPEHMEMLLRKLAAMGVRVELTAEGLRAEARGRLDAIDVATLPYPGVATDYKPFIVTMLSVADGVGIVTENLFAGRFRYVDELRRMGADIRTEGHHAVVRGVPRLSGAPVRASDIRAGAALVLAGLVAEGETEVAGAGHVDRGYEDLAGSLAALGARVVRR